MYLVSKSAIVSIPDIDRSHADYNKKGGENTPQRMKYNARTAKKEKRQQEFYYKSFFMLLCSVGKSLYDDNSLQAFEFMKGLKRLCP